MKEYEPETRSLDHLKLVAYRTVETCISVLGGRLGVGGKVQLYFSHDGSAFQHETEQGCALLEQGVEQWVTIEAESLQQVVLGDAPPAAEDAAAAEVPEAIEESG
jgi:hypothetical protein